MDHGRTIRLATTTVAATVRSTKYNVSIYLGTFVLVRHEPTEGGKILASPTRS